MVPENEKLPGCCCKSRGEGEIEFPPVDDGVSLIEALTAVELNFYQSVIFMHSRDFNRIIKRTKKIKISQFLNCCQSSSSSRLHPWYFDLVLPLRLLMVSPTGKMYLL